MGASDAQEIASAGTQPGWRRQVLAECPECGYSLSGLASPRCPECDREVTPAQLALLGRLHDGARRVAALHLIGAGVVVGALTLIGVTADPRLAGGYTVIGALVVAPVLLAGHLSCIGLRSSIRGPYRSAWMRLGLLLELTLLLAIAAAWLCGLAVEPHFDMPSATGLLIALPLWFAVSVALLIIAVRSWRRVAAQLPARKPPKRVVAGVAASVVLAVLGGVSVILVHWQMQGHLRFQCVVAGTSVATPAGPRPVEALVVGDEVWSLSDDGATLVRGRVTALRSATASSHRLIRVEGGLVLRATAVHPVRTQDGFVQAGLIRRGDLLLTRSGWRRVTAVETDRTQARVYDLTVEPQANFFADGVLVHNKEIVPPGEFVEP